MTRPAAQVEAEAAAWLARRDGDAWLPTDETALNEWVAASTENRVAFLRLSSVWGKADRLRAIGGSQVAASEEIEDPLNSLIRPSNAPRWRWFAPLAAAAAAAAFILPNWSMPPVGGTVYSTSVGGFQRLPLEDGSRIELNTDTKLDVAFGANERRIELDKGEAFFKVAKDRRRPFVVLVGDYRVTAVGTAFSVRLNSDHVDVTVTEGRVRVNRVSKESTSTKPMLLPAGHVVTATPEAMLVKVAPPDSLEQSLSWRDGLLIFNDRPLGEVAAEFNRYNRRQLIVDPTAANIKLGGTFRATNLDGFIRLLQQGFDVRATAAADPDRVLLRRL